MSIFDGVALDFGRGGNSGTSKLAWHGKDGPVEPCKLRGGTNADKFAHDLAEKLNVSDVVTESPTVGASGAEQDLIEKVVANSPHTLYTIPARAVKNFHRTHATPLEERTDAKAAEIIYKLAVENPDRLKIWEPVSDNERLRRKHHSVRPYDQRGYKGPEVEHFISLLPPIEKLTPELRALFVQEYKTKPARYKPSTVIQFAMALDEPSVKDRNSWEKVLGLYGHGYPSFYRRATVDLMIKIVKRDNDKIAIGDATHEQRKAAWQETRRLLRQLYSLAVT